jgi:hypothetical protein
VAGGLCRKIDVVNVKGSEVPMPIYTFDSHQNQRFPVLRTPKRSNMPLAMALEHKAREYNTGNIDEETKIRHKGTWDSDKDLVQLRHLSTEEFRKVFDAGVGKYLNGQWEEAKILLQQANTMMSGSDTGNDGPSDTLLKYMESKDWKCPDDWQGCRPLTSK